MYALLLWAAALAANPADWVPVRWPWAAPESLELLAGTAANCLLLEHYTPGLAAAASARRLAALAVLKPGADALERARRAAAAGMAGVVLEGDFPEGTAARLRAALPAFAVIELCSRSRMPLGSGAPVVGTYQGVWPGVQVLAGGVAKAAPTGSPWIDTNSGFVRAARAWGDAAVWVGNRPPENMVLPAERYLQAIADAALAGGRWVVAFDADLAARLERRESGALRDWKRISEMLAFFEAHREWRALRPHGRLAIVQDPASGALLSGGILDMIGARHIPVRAIPAARLTPEALAGATMAVPVEPESLTPAQRAILKAFTRAGGTLLTPAPGPPVRPGAGITLDKAEMDRVNDIFRDVQNMIGRHNLGVRLFNVSAVLSNLAASRDGAQVWLHLVNYSGYPMENVTVHLLGKYRRARLFAPGVERDLEVYSTEDGTGVDIDRIPIWASLRLD